MEEIAHVRLLRHEESRGVWGTQYFKEQHERVEEMVGKKWGGNLGFGQESVGSTCKGVSPNLRSFRASSRLSRLPNSDTNSNVFTKVQSQSPQDCRHQPQNTSYDWEVLTTTFRFDNS